MASQAQRDHVRRTREDAANNPSKYTSRRILSSVDRSSGTTRQDITDRAIAARDAEAPQVEPGTMGGTQVVEPAHTGLSNPALSNHQLRSPVNPFIHTRPASDINVKTATIQESIEQTKGRRTPEYTPEELTVRSQMVGGGSETLMYSPDERVALMESISAKGRRTPEYTPEELTVRSQMVGGGSETLMYTPDQRADLMESIHQKSSNTIANKINEDQLSGATSNADISAFSVRYYEGTKGIADTIKAGIPELKEHTGAAGAVLEYPVKSVAGLIEMGGMVPGGLEVLKENPGAIMPALAVGAYQSSYGTVKAFEENPLQVTSDFATVGLLGWGAGAGVGAVRGGVSRIPYTISKKATLPEGVMLKKTINAPSDTSPITKPTDIVPYGPKEQLTFASTPKEGMVDIYVKVPKGSEAEVLSAVTGEMQTISTPSGKMLQISDVHSSSPQASAVKAIGEPNKITMSDLVPSDMSPFEIIKKVDMDPIDISVQNVPKRPQITEYGAAYETNAIPDMQLGPGYKPNNLVKPITDLPVEINTKPVRAESIKLLSQGDAIVAPSGLFEPRPISLEQLFDTSTNEVHSTPVKTQTPKLFNPGIPSPSVFNIADITPTSAPSAPHTKTKAPDEFQLQGVMEPETKPSRLPFKDPDTFDVSTMFRPIADIQTMPASSIESLMSTGRKTSGHKSGSQQFNLDPEISTYKIKQPTTRGKTAKDTSPSFAFGRVQVPEMSISPFGGIQSDPFPTPGNLPKEDVFEDIFTGPRKHSDPHPLTDDPITISPRSQILEPPEFKFPTIPKSTSRSKSKSKRSQDPLDLLDKNLYNKYNDPLKVGASINADVKKLLRGGF